MNFSQAVEYVKSLGLSTKSADITRVKKALDALGQKNNFRVIHIAGTNGKGSVSSYVYNALLYSNIKAALFTSPDMFDIRERISANGKIISRTDFLRYTKIIKSKGLELSMFDFLYIMAVMFFNDKKIEVAVLETGLGGRFDATNTADKKIVTAITKIGIDHAAVLGATVELIAAEKCGIINNDITVTSFSQTKAALCIIKNSSKKLIVPDQSLLKPKEISPLGNRFIYKGIEYKTKMGGPHQIENALVAIEILENSGLAVTSDAIKKGLLSAFMPARLQVVSKNPLVIVDGAHNIDGALALRKALSDYSGFTAVTGFMKDKDYDGILKIVSPLLDKAILVKPNKTLRALLPEELEKTAKKYIKNTECAGSIKEGIELALSYNKPVLVFGSLYLAANVLNILNFDN
ncbi:MAG: hypothetical protein IKF53_01515 [Clostridia bacterium]|nr:hypothetical protein [Clostridia bacterium]